MGDFVCVGSQSQIFSISKDLAMLSTESGPLINNGNLFSGEMLELVELSNESFESFTETLSHLNQFCDFLDDYVVKSGEN